MDDLFMVVEELTATLRPKFEPILRCCLQETKVDPDNSIPHYLYNIGKNSGMMAMDIYGEPIGYVLYNKTENKPMLLLHFWVHPMCRRRKVGSRLMAYIVKEERPNLMMAILSDRLKSAHLFLKSLGFICTKIINNQPENSQYMFMTNRYGLMNRMSKYDPNTF